MYESITRIYKKRNHFPKMVLMIALPILRSKPALEVGMPVLRAIWCLACVIPSARFQEKVSPGIFIIH